MGACHSDCWRKADSGTLPRGVQAQARPVQKRGQRPFSLTHRVGPKPNVGPTARALPERTEHKLITQHFSWAEAIRNSGYASLHDVPPNVRDGARVHAKHMEDLREQINHERHAHGMPPTGIHINSWIRSPAHNKAVGGAGDSRHIHGDACDITVGEIKRLCPWHDGSADFDKIADRVFAHGGFGQYPAGARHVDSRGYHARWSSWTPGK